MDSWEKADNEFHILICCHKSEATNAKNWRRVKIQLRSELEKLKKISAKVSSASGEDSLAQDLGVTGKEKFELLGKNIDLDNLSKNGLSKIKLYQHLASEVVKA